MMEWTPEKLKRFRKALLEAKGKDFIFEGREFVPAYAWYLIEYLERKFTK